MRPSPRTSFHHQPEAQHPKSSAIHKLPADYPIYFVAIERFLAGELAEPLADLLLARGVPFAFVTGYQRDSIDRRYANVPLLQKPVEPDALEQILLSLLDAPPNLAAARGD